MGRFGKTKSQEDFRANSDYQLKLMITRNLIQHSIFGVLPCLHLNCCPRFTFFIARMHLFNSCFIDFCFHLMVLVSIRNTALRQTFSQQCLTLLYAAVQVVGSDSISSALVHCQTGCKKYCEKTNHLLSENNILIWVFMQLFNSIYMSSFTTSEFRNQNLPAALAFNLSLLI